MAMNLRLGEDDSALLRRLAEIEGVSMTEVVRRSLREHAARTAHEQRVGEAAREEIAHYRALLDRLARA